MLDFFAFRTKARETFSSLIVSVLMWERGSGAGGEITMYKVKVSGQGIGEAIATQGPDPELVLQELLRRVAKARQKVREARGGGQLRDLATRPESAYDEPTEYPLAA